MVEIRNRGELAAFLNGKLAELAPIIAVRAALRIFPLSRDREQSGNSLLPTARALFVSRTALQYDCRDAIDSALVAASALKTVGSAIYATRAAAATYALGKHLGIGDAMETVEAVADAAYSSGNLRNVAYNEAYQRSLLSARESLSESEARGDASSFASDGVLSSSKGARRAIWKSVEDDVSFLVREVGDLYSAHRLLLAPLWMGRPYRNILICWENLKRQLLASPQMNWQPWGEWYDACLRGGTTAFSELTERENAAFCMRLSAETNGFWSREIQVVNRDILDRLAALRIPAIPEQMAGPLETFERQGKVARQPSSPPDDPKGTLHSARQALIESIDDFETTFPTHNHAGLRCAFVRLRDGLGADYDSFDVIRVGSAAERLQGFALKADEIFLPDMAVEVVAFNVNLGRTLASAEIWADFCKGLNSDIDPTERDIGAVKDVASALMKTDALEDEVKLELDYEMLAADWEDGRPRERKILTRGVMNVLATMSRIALDGLKAGGRALGDGVKEGLKRGSEAVVVGIFMMMSAQLYQLAGQSPMFAFLAPVLNYLSGFGKKS
ncbi:hypothetical protein [Asticcacaulis solisilvae]|uniref:hypothetical protein n=1 Tax=Asticcacaulis solisilvae TaxID=1217274 RepID=UPI003FD6EA74